MVCQIDLACGTRQRLISHDPPLHYHALTDVSQVPEAHIITLYDTVLYHLASGRDLPAVENHEAWSDLLGMHAAYLEEVYDWSMRYIIAICRGYKFVAIYERHNMPERMEKYSGQYYKNRKRPASSHSNASNPFASSSSNASSSNASSSNAASSSSNAASSSSNAASSSSNAASSSSMTAEQRFSRFGLTQKVQKRRRATD
jgi:hypothetical protein